MTDLENDPRVAMREARLRLMSAEADHLELKNRSLRHELGFFENDQRQHGVYPICYDITPVTAAKTIELLDKWSRANPGADLTIVLTSPGGSVMDGFALYDHILDLRRRGHKVYTRAQGWVASMAVILLQAGDVRQATTNTFLMIHEPSASAGRGSAAELADNAKFLGRLNDKGAAILAERSSKTSAQFKNLMKRKETWFDAEDALKIGLVDEVI